MEQEIKKPTKDESVKKLVLRIIGEVFFWITVCFVGSIFLFQGLDKATNYSCPFFGLRQSVIVSESMSEANEVNTYLTEDMKRIKKYDVILTMNYSSYNDIKLYDVMTYSSHGTLICHRVVNLYEEEGVQYIVTRGDSNNIDDIPITFSDVRGKVINVYRGAGHFILFVQSPYFITAFFSSVFFVCLGIFIYTSDKTKKKKKNKTEAKDKPNEIEIKDETQSV